MATVDQDGKADISPKGDPAGALLGLHEGAVWYPDRPGNRRIDSFRNIMSQPNIALLAMIPGCEQVVVISGKAEPTTDNTMRQAFTVRETEPKLVTRVTPYDVSLQHSPAIARARLWPVEAPPEGIDATETLKAHVSFNQANGM